MKEKLLLEIRKAAIQYGASSAASEYSGGHMAGRWQYEVAVLDNARLYENLTGDDIRDRLREDYFDGDRLWKKGIVYENRTRKANVNMKYVNKHLEAMEAL